MLFKNKSNSEKNPKPIINKEILINTEKTLEERVSALIFQVNTINVIGDISDIYNNLKISKSEAINAYQIVSNTIKEELVNLVEDIHQYKLKNLELEKQIELISVEIKAYASSEDPNKSIDTCSEYKKFLAAYQESLAFSQEIVAKKMRIEVLMETQKILDSSYASKVNEIDFQLLKLSDIIDNFQQIKTESLKHTSSPEFNYVASFKGIILEKEQLFENICKDLKLSTSNKLAPMNPYSKDGLNTITSIFDSTITS